MKDSGKQEHSIDRREVLALGAAGVGALALNGSPLSLTRAFAATGSARPNFYPAPVAPADIPGDANGLEPAYVNFPKKLVKLVDETPGRGGEVNCLSLWVWPIPTPVAQNAGWQQFQKKVNANIKMNYVPQADYAAKWGTVTAGGDLPDILYISLVPVLPNIAAFVNSACAELPSIWRAMRSRPIRASPTSRRPAGARRSSTASYGACRSRASAPAGRCIVQAEPSREARHGRQVADQCRRLQGVLQGAEQSGQGTLGDGRHQRHDVRPLLDELVPGHVPRPQQVAAATPTAHSSRTSRPRNTRRRSSTIANSSSSATSRRT